MQPYEARVRAWQRIATDLPLEKLDALIHPATLTDVPKLATEILRGKIRGRVVVDVNQSTSTQ
jgi:acrylyl-CoA reductase (NADPH)